MAFQKAIKSPNKFGIGLNSFFSRITKYWSPEKEAKLLLTEVRLERTKTKKLVEEVKSLKSWLATYNTTLNELTNSIKALVWNKNADHKYILANHFHCESFFGFSGSIDCLKHIIGKTDKELLIETYSDRDIQNTFSDICLLSDNYTMDKSNSCHFFESGVVAGDLVLLYVVKIPQYSEDGKFSGTLGVGLDITHQRHIVMQQLTEWISGNKVSSLYHNSDTFVYTVLPSFQKCSIFDHICPQSQSNLDCPSYLSSLGEKE
jgi:hypothetical protein